MELFMEVRKAEDKADAVVSEAQREARELIKQTEAECQENERNAAHEHRTLYQSMLEKRRDDMQSMLDAGAAAALSGMEAQMSKARKRLPNAVKQIVERVLNDGNR